MTGFDRRTMLRGMGAIGMAGMIGGTSRVANGQVPGQPFFTRIGKPIGLQLYALGNDIAADLAGTFRAVAAMGYGEIELPSLLGSTAPALRALADEAGLKIASLHIPPAPFAPGQTLTFQNDPDEIAQIAGELGITQVVAPIPIVPEGFAFREGEDFPATFTREFSAVGVDYWRRMAERFNTIGEAMKARGLTFAYHNHNLEFAPTPAGPSPFDVLLSRTNPALVKFQLDIGWAVTAGHEPVALIEAMARRLVSVHVKDVAADNQQGYYFGTSPTEVGSGTIDWARVLPACHAAGVQHYFVEQEPPFTIPRAEAAAKSVAFLKTLEA